MSSSEEYDLIVLGGGTGGYAAAIRASQLGLKVAIVERDKLGGTCLHRGCVPSKVLLRSAEVYHTMRHSEEFGIEATNIQVNFSAIQQRKENIVDQLHRGIHYLMAKGKIDVIQGEGRIMGPSIFSPRAGAIAVTKPDGESDIYVSEHVLIATGSRPRLLSGLTVDGTYVVTSDEALDMAELPKSMIIVGAGTIGIEWASLLNDLDVHVQLIESTDRILPFEDADISREMTRLLTARGVDIHTETEIKPDTFVQEGQQVSITAMHHGEPRTFEADQLLLSIGRAANVEQIGLDNTDVMVENGTIRVNAHYQTKEAHMYAIGDVIGGLQLAHVAVHEGIVAVEHMAGVTDHLPIQALHVPKITYSRPETACVGYSEQEAIDEGFSIQTSTFPFSAIGKALIEGSTDGFIKFVINKETNDLLGVHLIGPGASDLISEAALAQVLDATPWEISNVIHPHPTLSEIFGEVALAVDGKAIHL